MALLRVFFAIGTAAFLGGCLNAASGGNKPAGSAQALLEIKREEPVVRLLVARTLSSTPLVKGGLLTGRHRVTNAKIAGPHIHQDILTKDWAVLFCVTSDVSGIIPQQLRALVAVTKHPGGWRVSSRGEAIGVQCPQTPVPFSEFEQLANGLADAEAKADP